MKVILTADVKKVGQKGTVVEVADGYAQNVLIPKKLAVPAIGGNLKSAESAAARSADKRAIDEGMARITLQKLDGATVTVLAKTNGKGSLFKAVSVGDVVAVIEKEFQITLPESALAFDPIKKTGPHPATVTLRGTTAKIILNITQS